MPEAGIGCTWNEAANPYADVFINASDNHEDFAGMMYASGNGYHSPAYMLGIKGLE